MIACEVIDQNNLSKMISFQAKPAVGEVIKLDSGWGMVRRVEHSDGRPLVIYIDMAR